MKVSRAYLKKFGLRLLTIIIIFYLVKFTLDPKIIYWSFNKVSVFHFLSAFFLFMLTWETNDWFLKKNFNNKYEKLNINSALKILVLNMLLLAPIAATIYYVALFVFGLHCLGEKPNLWLQFRIDFFRAALLGFSVIVFNLLYYFLNQKKELDNQMNVLKKELMTAQYQSLKDQISPHFLFNSLNTLTSLMYQDRDLASDFVSRLASCYRYILDNREKDIIALEQELSFLDSFIFMMNVRHSEALNINIDIESKVHHLKIPTLSLQMLLENALKHNSYSPQKPLNIDIFSTEDNYITIKNNLQLRPKEETTVMGIENIKKRYAFHTIKEVIINESQEFFTIRIPLIH